MNEEYIDQLLKEAVKKGYFKDKEPEKEEVILEEVPVKHIPTHEELRAEGIDLPDWVPVEDILIDTVAQRQLNFAYWQMINAYREREWEVKHA